MNRAFRSAIITLSHRVPVFVLRRREGNAIHPPPLHSREGTPVRVGRAELAWWARAVLLVVALLFVALFGIAFLLDPYRDGRVWQEGTHRQLGLPPCTMKGVTGLPCPSCGMSTSFALLVRGDLVNSARANWVGMLLALTGLLYVPWGVACAWKGRWLGIRNVEPLFIRLVLGFLLLLFVRWGIVLATMGWSGE